MNQKLTNSIIDLIKPYMDKILAEGCLVKTTINSAYGDYFDQKESAIEKLNKKLMFRDVFGDQRTVSDFLEIYGNIYDTDEYGNRRKAYDLEVIGHFDISSVLRYLHDEKTFSISIHSSDYFKIQSTDSAETEHFLPNKPIYLYSDQEAETLLSIFQ